MQSVVTIFNAEVGNLALGSAVQESICLNVVFDFAKRLSAPPGTVNGDNNG